MHAVLITFTTSAGLDDLKGPFTEYAKALKDRDGLVAKTWIHDGTTLGGFHIINLDDEEWILEAGSYWASEGDIQLSAYRESMWNSFWAGDGLLKFRTKVHGTGNVVVRTPGPVEVVAVNGSYRTEGPIVVGRTGSLAYKVRRPTRRLIDYALAGETFLKSFEGDGKLLTCPTPYWRMRFQEMLRTR